SWLAASASGAPMTPRRVRSVSRKIRPGSATAARISSTSPRSRRSPMAASSTRYPRRRSPTARRWRRSSGIRSAGPSPLPQQVPHALPAAPHLLPVLPHLGSRLHLGHQPFHAPGDGGHEPEPAHDLGPLVRLPQTVPGAGEEALVEPVVEAVRGVGERLQLLLELLVAGGEIGASILLLLQEGRVRFPQLLAGRDQLAAEPSELLHGQLAGSRRSLRFGCRRLLRSGRRGGSLPRLVFGGRRSRTWGMRRARRGSRRLGYVLGLPSGRRARRLRGRGGAGR